jgi:hypothetical protein
MQQNMMCLLSGGNRKHTNKGLAIHPVQEFVIIAQRMDVGNSFDKFFVFTIVRIAFLEKQRHSTRRFHSRKSLISLILPKKLYRRIF